MLDKEMIRFVRPTKLMLRDIHDFFELVIEDTFEQNGIGNLLETMNDEIIDKKKCLDEDFDSFGRERYFLIAMIGDEIVGCIEFGVANDLIRECTGGELSDIPEIGTVFVHPGMQRKGISRMLFDVIISEMKLRGIKEYCFDSGYKIAQGIWRERYGEPAYHLKDFWGEGADHMVWLVRI